MKKSKMLASKTSRTIVQAIMLVIIIGGASLRNLLNHTNKLVALWPELQGFCPFGAVQSIFRGFFDYSYLLRSGYSNQWVLLGVLLITILFGAVFCSTLCPLGSLQEWIGKLGKKLLKKKYNLPVPKKINMVLKSLRFIVLGLLFVSVAGLVVWNLDYINPSYALSHLWTSVVPFSAILVLALFLLLSLIYERPWCRWLCPYGVLLGMVGRLSFFKIRRSSETCINCSKCDRACPLSISVSTKDKVSSSSCNRCMNCISSCPIPHTLAHTSPIKMGAKQIKPVILPILVLFLFFLPFGIASAASWHIPKSLQPALASVEKIDFSVQNISPMISLSTLAEQAQMERETLAILLGLPLDYDFSTLLIDIEEDDEHMDITLGFIREKLAEYFDQEE